jgi:hypothetical protein
MDMTTMKRYDVEGVFSSFLFSLYLFHPGTEARCIFAYNIINHEQTKQSRMEWMDGWVESRLSGWSACKCACNVCMHAHTNETNDLHESLLRRCFVHEPCFDIHKVEENEEGRDKQPGLLICPLSSIKMPQALRPPLTDLPRTDPGRA